MIPRHDRDRGNQKSDPASISSTGAVLPIGMTINAKATQAAAHKSNITDSYMQAPTLRYAHQLKRRAPYAARVLR